MARDLGSKCRLCRRAGEKLFLKGERCDTQKCAMIRRSYPPGMHGKKGVRNISEYGKQLAMKQRIKRIYGILEKQFRKHFEEIANKPGVTGDLLLSRLEMRLDNVIYRMGFASSRTQARQFVGHGMFFINNHKVNIPSYKVKEGEVITLNPVKKDKKNVVAVKAALKSKKNIPAWIEIDVTKMKGKILGEPSRSDVDANVNPQMVVEYYSK